MKRKRIIALLCCVCILVFHKYRIHQTVQISKLTILNIDALATGEDDENYFCYGIGSLDCNGQKVYEIFYLK